MLNSAVPAAVMGSGGPALRHRIRLVAGLYKEALTEERTYAPAVLRLGNLHAGLGEEALAIERFTVASRADDPRIRYLALLFTGQIHARGGRLDEAERFYQSALHEYPTAQGPVFARAELLSRTGRETESRQLLAGHLAPGLVPIVDPLWTFRLPEDLSAAFQLDELRVEVMQ